MLTFQVTHMHFRITQLGLLRQFRSNNIEESYLSRLSERVLILYFEA